MGSSSFSPLFHNTHPREYQECNLGETQPEANAKLEALKDYLKNIKPGKAVEKMDIESLYAPSTATYS